MPKTFIHLLPKKQSTVSPVVVSSTSTVNKPRPWLFKPRAPNVAKQQRVPAIRSARAPRKGGFSQFLVICALAILFVGYVMPTMNQPAAAGFNPITPNPNATITATPFQPEPLKIKQGTCPDGEFFMDMYDKPDPVTGVFGIGVVVFDAKPAQKICIPEMKYFEQMIANGKSGEELLKDPGYVNYTGLLASRMAIQLGLPDTDLVARQGLRRAIAIAILLAMESTQPADDPSTGARHGFIMMPGDAMIAAATDQVRKEVAARPNIPVMAVPKGQSGQVVQTVPTPREVLETQVKAECTAKGATDVEKCVKSIVDAYLAKSPQDQTPDHMKGLVINYFIMLTPTPTNAPIAVPGDSSYATFEQKVVESCALTKHPEACVSMAKKTYAETNDLFSALKAGIPAGNAECSVLISEISFADLSSRSDVWSAAGVLHVWRVDNNNASVLTGVGFANGVFAVCIDRITGAPSTVAQGSWETRSDNLVQSASQYAAQYAGGGYFTGGIISKSNIYPADPGGGVYHVAADTTRMVFEIPIGGVFVSPVIGVVQIQPTKRPADTPLPAPIQRIIAITSTFGPPPPPVDVGIGGLYDWAAARGYTMFYMRYACSGTPPSVVLMNDGRFSANVDLSGYQAGCPGGYFVITTDNMSGQSGWTNVGSVWYTTQ